MSKSQARDVRKKSHFAKKRFGLTRGKDAGSHAARRQMGHRSNLGGK